MKRLHLVTDAGFLRSALLWLALEAALLGCAWSHAPLRFSVAVQRPARRMVVP